MLTNRMVVSGSDEFTAPTARVVQRLRELERRAREWRAEQEHERRGLMDAALNGGQVSPVVPGEVR